MSVQALVIINKENIPVLIRMRRAVSDGESGVMSGAISGAIDVANGDVNSDATTINALFHIHATIDMIEERQTQRDSYLGLLTQSESHKIYGFSSTTNTKIVMMVLPHAMRDNEARAILKSVHNAYIDVTTSNPFYSYGEPINSKHLDSVIDGVFENY